MMTDQPHSRWLNAAAGGALAHRDWLKLPGLAKLVSEGKIVVTDGHMNHNWVKLKLP